MNVGPDKQTIQVGKGSITIDNKGRMLIGHCTLCIKELWRRDGYIKSDDDTPYKIRHDSYGKIKGVYCEECDKNVY